MEHPLLKPEELKAKSIEDLEKIVADLNRKISYAQRMPNGGHITSQLYMVIESYRNVLNAKINEKYNSSQGNNNPYTTTVDITS